MKKIFTLLVVAATMVTSAFAQNDHGYQRDERYNKNGNDVVNDSRYKKDDTRFNEHNSFNEREQQMQIAQINREYDYKIQAIQNKFFMGRARKERYIAILENQRQTEIRMACEKFNDHGNRFAANDQPRHW